MALSARNQLPGTIEEIQIGDIMAHVTVRVGDNIIESVITCNSAEELGLKKGDAVKVVVKSTEVMIQKTDGAVRLTILDPKGSDTLRYPLLIVVSISISASTVFGQQPAFDLASIKQGDPDVFTPPNFPLDAGDSFSNMRTHELPSGRFLADFPLSTYITFAYKLTLTQEQMRAMLANLPKWVGTERFNIQARAEGNPTKDQMRLMMQSLLAERFKLAVHFEVRETPVLALTLVKPGKTGPKLRPHSDGPPCDAPQSQQTNGTAETSAEVFPSVCDVYGMRVNSSRLRMGGSRNTTMERLAVSLPSFGGVDRPVVDQTGLSGTFDFTLEWLPESTNAAAADASSQPESQGTTFLEALREQLGLKLESSKAPLKTLVIDHVDRPSEN